ncbi:MAG: hypothetical protein ACKOU6_02225 [Planctomycetota bacterium]
MNGNSKLSHTARRLVLGVERLERRECRASDIAPGLGLQESPYAAAWCFPVAPGGTAAAEAEMPPAPAVDPTMNVLTDGEVKILLDRAAAASARQDAIIAVLDRSGRILGVRVEQDVADRFAGDIHKMTFAIDGAVAVARTAAQFAHNQAPLTSRTIRNLSLSDVTEREVESNPTLPNPVDPANNNPWDNSQPVAKTYGPGFVAPIGVNGHFPQGINFTPPVDLFGIERQSRDSLVHPGADDLKGTADDIALAGRFNIPQTAYAPGKTLFAPESYGVVSGLLPYSQARGFGTLPGGIPIFKFVQDKVTGKFGALPEMVGGIGVFFPGPDGYATFEQNFQSALTLPGGEPQSDYDRTNAPLELEAEWMAFSAVGGIRVFNPVGSRYGDGSVGTIGGIDALPNFGLPFGRIDLAGITLEVYGPNPTQQNPLRGFETLILKGRTVGQENVRDGNRDGVNALLDPLAPNPYLRFGITPPDGWIVPPRVSPDGSSDLTVADIEKIVMDGVAKADQTRAAIRLDLVNLVNGLPGPGPRTRMVLAVGDRSGNILGLFRMPDATMFSIDVAVAKARNTAYYANPDLLRDLDKVDDDLLVAANQATVDELLQSNAFLDGLNNHEADLFLDANGQVPATPPAGVAFTNRTFRFLAEPHYPAGIEELPPVFSSLFTIGVDEKTGENESLNPALVPNASDFSSVFGWTAFRNGRNFRNPSNLANQNGVVYFPGSTALYKGNSLIGGFGVSGDGVDQDDVVTAAGQGNFAPPLTLRADAVFYRGVRLPFQKFNRNPLG